MTLPMSRPAPHQEATPHHNWRANWRGLLILPTVALVLAAVLSPVWPDWPLMDDLGRMLENALPYLVLLSVLMSGALMLAGAARIGAVLMLVAVLGSSATLLSRHLPRALPLAADRQADLQVLWMNLLWSNDIPPDQLIAALVDSPADLVILGEATPLAAHLDALKSAFPYQAGCDTARRCEILVLSRQPVAEMKFQPMPDTRPGRLVTVRVASPDGPDLTVMAAHLLKPWFGDMAHHDDWLVIRELARRSGPLLLVGDFNATPWSRRMVRINTLCGLRAPRLPVPSWPAAAGPLGLPIDLTLVRGGTRLTALAPWGGDLGSDHRGLLTGVSIGGSGDFAAVPATCTLPETVRQHFGL